MSDIATDEGRRGGLRFLLLGALLIALFPLAGIVRRIPAALASDHSIGDLAVVELSVVEATHGERLLGQTTRLGLHQIGPSHCYLQVPLYVALGRQRPALSITCVVVNWLALIAFGYALVRWYDNRLAVWIWLLLLPPYFGYYESATLFNYWPQYLIVLPTMPFIACAAAVATGRRAMWPAVLGLASFIVQGYGSTLLPVAVVVASLLALELARSARRRPPPTGQSGGRRSWAIPVTASAVVLLLFWTPPVLEQLRNSPGNLELFWQRATGAHIAAIPPFAAVAASFSKHLAAPWMNALFGITVNTPLSALQTQWAEAFAALELALLAFTAALAWRRGRLYSAAVSAICLALVLASALAVRRLDGDLFPYIFFWLSACGLVGWLSALGTLGSLLGAPLLARFPRLRVDPDRTVLVGATLLAVVLTVRPIPIPRLGDQNVGPLADAIRSAAQASPGSPLHIVSHDLSWPWTIALLVQLDHDGHRVSIENVQGETSVGEFQGISKRWLERAPGSTDFQVFDHDMGQIPGLRRLHCQPVLPLVGERELCAYSEPR